MTRAFIFVLLLLSTTVIHAQNDTAAGMPLNEAFTYYQKLLEKNPQSPFANYGLAKCNYLSGNYRTTISIAKDFSFKNNAFQSDFVILYSMALIASEQMDRSISVISKAMDIFPDNCELYYYRSLSYYKLSNLSSAFSDVKKSIELKDSYYPSHLLMGIILYERNNDRNAIAPLFYALFLNSKDIWSKNALFIIHSILNQKHDRLVIPYHEERFKIKNIEDLLTVYCSGYKVKDWSPSILNFIAYSSDYIKDNYESMQNLDHIYYDFFSRLVQSHHLTTYCYYILQSLDSKEVKDWYSENSNALMEFADWIDKTL